MVKGIKTLHAKVGSKLVTWNLGKEKISDADLKRALIGRSGTMRAPVLIVGTTMMGGFDEGIYKKLLKK